MEVGIAFSIFGAASFIFQVSNLVLAYIISILMDDMNNRSDFSNEC